MSSRSAYTPHSSNVPSRNGWWATFCATAPRLKLAKKVAPKPAQAKESRPRRLHRKAGAAKRPEQNDAHRTAGLGSHDAARDDGRLPRACNVGCKPNSKGVREYWTGYKLHMDVADGQIPISCVLTSASLNDNQVAIPLALLTAQRVTKLL